MITLPSSTSISTLTATNCSHLTCDRVVVCSLHCFVHVSKEGRFLGPITCCNEEKQIRSGKVSGGAQYEV